MHYIERDDGKFYVGTVGYNAVWGDRSKAASFRTKEEAEVRITGLKKRESGREFKVVPV